MSKRNFAIIENGVEYALPAYRVEDGKGIVETGDTVNIKFVRGSKLKDEEVEKKEGTLHEHLLSAMIHDMKFKNSLVPSREGSLAITNLEQALMWMEERQKVEKQPVCKELIRNTKTIKMEFTEAIAKVCHEANKAFCEANGDLSQKHWAEAEAWQRESAVKGVQFRIDNPTAGHDAQHNSWMQEKVEQGWIYGEVKDAEAKTHPCLVPFEELPLFQQKKDALFCAIVDALK